MRVFTSHWRSSLLRDVDATIIGISRGTPRGNPGFRYRVLRSLAPGDRAWRQEGQEEFERAYLDQLEALGVERILGDLKRVGTGRPCICLCWERLADPDEYCHRLTLSRFLEREADIRVLELQPSDLPRRPDAPQPSLFDSTYSYREEKQ